MCNEELRIEPYSLAFVPDHSKTQKMCDKAIEIDPFTLWHVPDNLKTHRMCIRAAEGGPGFLEYVPDWFQTQQQLKIWHDDDGYYYDDKLNTMVIKNGSKSKNRRRIFTYCLASIKMVGLVCVRRREKVVEVTDSCFKNYLIC